MRDHAHRAREGKRLHVDLMHRAVAVTVTPDGLRALAKDRPISPDSVEKYLAGKFGDDLDAATTAMRALAKFVPPRTLAKEANRLYEHFLPNIPPGVKGWGAAGELKLDGLTALAQ